MTGKNIDYIKKKMNEAEEIEKYAINTLTMNN